MVMVPRLNAAAPSTGLRHHCCGEVIVSLARYLRYLAALIGGVFAAWLLLKLSGFESQVPSLLFWLVIGSYLGGLTLKLVHDRYKSRTKEQEIASHE